MVCNNILHDIDFVRGATRGDEIEPKLNKFFATENQDFDENLDPGQQQQRRKYSVKTET